MLTLRLGGQHAFHPSSDTWPIVLTGPSALSIEATDTELVFTVYPSLALHFPTRELSVKSPLVWCWRHRDVALAIHPS
jgi:hypothetical protein